jgi:sialate O-acetylesterase
MMNVVSRIVSIAFVASILPLFTGAVVADVRLPAVFGDHMVLQQQMKIRIWGWADAGEAVTVSLGTNSATAKPDETGRWQVELPEMTASKTSR